MKKVISLSIALFLLAVTVMPVFAASETAGPRSPFALVGKITAIDADAGTVTVKILRGNWVVKPYLNQEVVLKTTANTRYLYKASATAVPTPITFEDLQVGKAISASGTLRNGVWTATRITMGAKLSCFP